MSAQVDLGDETISLVVPAGPYLRFEGTGIRLVVAGQRISADVVFEQVTDDATTTNRITLSNVEAAFGTGTTTIVALTGGFADLELTDAGVIGEIGGTVAINLPGVAAQGTFVLALDTGAGTIGFTGSDIDLTIAGQVLEIAEVSFAQETDTTGAKTVKVSLTGASLTLAGIGTITMGGDLVSGAGGVAGVLTLTLDELTLGTATLAGDFRVAVNTGAQAVEVGGDRLPAGPYFRIEGDGLVLTVGDALTLTGSFAVEQATSSTGAARTVLAVSGVSLVIGGAELLTDVEGLLVMVPASGASPAGLAAACPARWTSPTCCPPPSRSAAASSS